MDWGMDSRPRLHGYSREQRKGGARKNGNGRGVRPMKGGGTNLPLREGGRERNVDGQPQGLPLPGAVGPHTGCPSPSSRRQAIRGENGGGWSDLRRATTRVAPTGEGDGGWVPAPVFTGAFAGKTDGRRGSVMGSEIPRGVSEWHVGEGAALRMTHANRGAGDHKGPGKGRGSRLHGRQALRGNNGWGE